MIDTDLSSDDDDTDVDVDSPCWYCCGNFRSFVILLLNCVGTVVVVVGGCVFVGISPTSDAILLLTLCVFIKIVVGGSSNELNSGSLCPDISAIIYKIR